MINNLPLILAAMLSIACFDQHQTVVQILIFEKALKKAWQIASGTGLILPKC